VRSRQSIEQISAAKAAVDTVLMGRFA